MARISISRLGRFYSGDGVFDDGVNTQRPELRGRPGGIPIDAFGATGSTANIRDVSSRPAWEPISAGVKPRPFSVSTNSCWVTS